MEVQEFTNHMEVQDIANMYSFLLISAAIIAGIIGFFVSKYFKNIYTGFIILCLVSIFSLFFIIKWFNQAASESFMGTIPWFFNIVGAIVLLPIYLLVLWFIYKKLLK